MKLFHQVDPSESDARWVLVCRPGVNLSAADAASIQMEFESWLKNGAAKLCIVSENFELLKLDRKEISKNVEFLDD